VLIGADGAGSRVRAQLLPHAERIETGIMAVTGKYGLNGDVRATTPQAIFRGSTLIFGPRGCFLFGSAVEYGEAIGTERARRDEGRTDSTAREPLPYDREEYVMWGFSAHREAFASPANFETLSGEDLKAAVVALMDDWHPAIRRLVHLADPSTVTAFPVKTSIPIPP
jgi:hypothetical protein